MRVNIPAADEIIDLYFPTLDGGGFIALKDYMGSDASVIQAARNSYSKGTKKVSDDRTLLRRLIRDHHDSPTEFAEMSFHIRAPLYIIQQWLRHRTNNFCQESHRFSEVKLDFQTTKPDSWRLQDKDNKQGSDGILRAKLEKGQEYEDYFFGEEITGEEYSIHEELKRVYNQRIRAGIAREQARKDIPVSAYSSIFIKCDVRNLLHFLKLRTAPDAQIEIREYANLMAGMVKRFCPLMFEAWVDYAFAAKSFTRLDILFLSELPYYIHPDCCFAQLADFKSHYEHALAEGVEPYHEQIGMSKRELSEFWKKLIPVEIPNFDLDLSKGVKK